MSRTVSFFSAGVGLRPSRAACNLADLDVEQRVGKRLHVSDEPVGGRRIGQLAAESDRVGGGAPAARGRGGAEQSGSKEKVARMHTHLSC